jgi:hypothetical protein
LGFLIFQIATKVFVSQQFYQSEGLCCHAFVDPMVMRGATLQRAHANIPREALGMSIGDGLTAKLGKLVAQYIELAEDATCAIGVRLGVSRDFVRLLFLNEPGLSRAYRLGARGLSCSSCGWINRHQSAISHSARLARA